MSEKFDVIIIGAGPAGLSAAYILAGKGLKTLVFERGEYPGSKNVSGALLHTHALKTLFPDNWQNAPLERNIVRHKISLLTERASVSFDYMGDHFGKSNGNGFTVLRSKFDRWLAEKAEDAGAVIMTSTQVDDFILEMDKVVGVRTRKEGGDIYADVVIIAEGANTILTEKAGLKKNRNSEHMAVAAKEIIKLDGKIINERFNLKGNQGASLHFIGDCTKGVPGGGFIYTNKESLSLGIVCRLDGLVKQKMKIFELVEDFKSHPAVRCLIEGGDTREYSGHMIPEGGYKAMPQLYSDGVLVVGEAASFNFNNGFIIRGIDFAIKSGIIAANTVVHAKFKGDFSKNGLSIYRKLLGESFVLKDMKRFKKLADILSNPRVFTTYPNILSAAAREMFDVNGGERKGLLSIMESARRAEGSDASIDRIVRDLIKIGFNL